MGWRFAHGTAWRIVEGLTILGVAAAVTMALAVYRSDEIQDVRLDAHAETLGSHGDRLSDLERPEVLLQIASAEEKVEKLEAAAEVSQENATAIAAVQATQAAQTRQLDGIEREQAETNRALRQILIRLPNGQVGRPGQPTPAPAPAPSE